MRPPSGLQASAGLCLLPVRSFVRLCRTFLRSPLLRLSSLRKSGLVNLIGDPVSPVTCRVTFFCAVASLSRKRRFEAPHFCAIIRFMQAKLDHPWNVTPAEARAIQETLRSKVRAKNATTLRRVKHVAGVDISIRDDRAIAAVVVLDFNSLEIVDYATHEAKVPFPYVPGLLSFRECPTIIAAAKMLRVEPDLIMVDGQGIAHPRRLGIAAHVGLLFDKPTIGCAKTRLTGKHEEPALEAGSRAELWDRDELIGNVLRTKNKCRPLYISVGHKIDLPTAIDLVLKCCRGYRLPEPTRLAHQVAGGKVPPLTARR